MYASLFPAFVLLTTCLSSIFQFSITTVSIIELILISLSLIFDSPLFAVIAFSFEAGFCLFELFSGKCKNLPLIIHHVSTPMVIQFSLLLFELDYRLLAKLCLSFSVSTLIIAWSKKFHLKDKKWIRVSFLSLILFRLIVPIQLIYVIAKLLWASRPEWTRLYFTSVLMLYSLNVQIAIQLWPKI